MSFPDDRPLAILLDLDGTLIDSLRDIALSVDHVRAEFGLVPLMEHGVRPLIGRGLRALLADGLAEAAGRAIPSEAEIDRGVELYDDHHAANLLTSTAPYPEVDRTLRSWAEDGHKLAVVTNKPHRFAKVLIEEFGWAGLFGSIVGGDSAARKKPHPAPIELALRELRVASADAVMVGDSAPDILGGRNAGTRTVAVTYGFTDRPALERLRPDRLWDRFGGDWPGRVPA